MKQKGESENRQLEERKECGHCVFLGLTSGVPYCPVPGCLYYELPEYRVSKGRSRHRKRR